MRAKQLLHRFAVNMLSESKQHGRECPVCMAHLPCVACVPPDVCMRSFLVFRVYVVCEKSALNRDSQATWLTWHALTCIDLALTRIDLALTCTDLEKCSTVDMNLKSLFQAADWWASRLCLLNSKET